MIGDRPMETATSREFVAAGDLTLPPCLIPRPGDSVVWYQEGNRRHGVLRGSTRGGTAVIEWPSGFMTEDTGFASVRIADRATAVGPMWLSLPQQAVICRPTSEESLALARLAGQEVYPGPSHRELAAEIWARGFEVFFTGEPVRRALTNNEVIDAELITTMPGRWLDTLLKDMYGSVDFEKDQDRFLVGEIVGSTNAYAYVRLFRSAFRNNEHIYGASFEHEISFNDFAFNTIYFDPNNDVLIDPTGYGIEDALGYCLRPLAWSQEMPRKAKDAIGLQVLRQHLYGCMLCPGREVELLRFVADLGRLGTDALCNALAAEVFMGRELTINHDATEIATFLSGHGMGGLWLQKFQPAITTMKARMLNGGAP
jgi:hypothetical protein